MSTSRLLVALFICCAHSGFAVNQLSLDPMEGPPGGAVWLVLRSDSLSDVAQINLVYASPAVDALNTGHFGSGVNTYGYPLALQLAEGGPVAWKAWPTHSYGGLTVELGAPGPLGFRDARGLPYNSDQSEVVQYALLRISSKATIGTEYPLSLNYDILDLQGGELGSGTLTATVRVGSPPPPSPPAVGTGLRVGTYRAPAGGRVRVYIQAGPAFTGRALHFSRWIPGALIPTEPSTGFSFREWPFGPPGVLTRGDSRNMGYSRFGDPRFGDNRVGDQFVHETDLSASQPLLNPPPVLLRYYVDVPPGAAPGTVYPLHVDGTVVDDDFRHFTPVAAEDGAIIVDPAVSLIPGDVNGDGKVNVADAVLALRIAVGLDQPTARQMDQILQTADLSPLDICDLASHHLEGCLPRPVQITPPPPGQPGEPVVTMGPAPLAMGRGDGHVTVGDVIKILRLAVGLPLDAHSTMTEATP